MLEGQQSFSLGSCPFTPVCSSSLLPSYPLEGVLPTPKNRHLSVHEVSSRDKGKSSPGQAIDLMEINLQEQKL